MSSLCKEYVSSSQTLNAAVFGSYLEANPCASFVAFLTYKEQRGVQIPLDLDEQGRLFYEMTGTEAGMHNLAKTWEAVVQEEAENIKSRCATRDLDILIILDSSGSVGFPDWEEQNYILMDHWLPVINPTPSCENE